MSDGESREPRAAGGEVRVPIPVAPRRPSELPPEDAGSGPGGSPGAGGSPGRDPPPELASEEEEQVPYPALAPTAFFCLKQTTRPRSWCLRLVCNPYPFPGGTAPPPIPGDPPLCTWSTPLGSASPGSPPLGCSEVPRVSPASPFRAVPVPISWGVQWVLPPHHPYGMLRGCVPTFATPWPRGGHGTDPASPPGLQRGRGIWGVLSRTPPCTHIREKPFGFASPSVGPEGVTFGASLVFILDAVGNFRQALPLLLFI